MSVTHPQSLSQQTENVCNTPTVTQSTHGECLQRHSQSISQHTENARNTPAVTQSTHVECLQHSHSHSVNTWRVPATHPQSLSQHMENTCKHTSQSLGQHTENACKHTCSQSVNTQRMLANTPAITQSAMPIKHRSHSVKTQRKPANSLRQIYKIHPQWFLRDGS